MVMFCLMKLQCQINHIPQHGLGGHDSEPHDRLLFCTSTPVLNQDTFDQGIVLGSDSKGLCNNRYMNQLSENLNNVVHGTVFTAADQGSSSTSAKEYVLFV